MRDKFLALQVRVRNRIHNLTKDRSGVAALEYAILGAVVLGAIAVIIPDVTAKLGILFGKFTTALDTVAGS